MNFDTQTKELLNNRTGNISSLSHPRSDLKGRGIYRKNKPSPRLGSIFSNRVFMDDPDFTLLCMYQTDGGSNARSDDGCGAAWPKPGQVWTGQCSRLEPPITTTHAWLVAVHTHPSPCGDHFDFFKGCSINSTMFDTLFVPITRR